MTATREFVIKNEVGLHARPAALFVKTVSPFSSDIMVENLVTGSDPVNAKSILSVLSIGVEQNHRVRITAEGDDEDQAISALVDLIERDFKEYGEA